MSAGERLPGTPTPMHTWIGAGGLMIAGDTWGDPHGPLVVLQHGGGQTRHAWKGAGETLGNAAYHAVAFDARGHGDSGWAPPDKYGQDSMVKDLICVVEALGSARPILVGASMGGGTSLIAIGESHLEASALVLVDMAPHIEAEGARRIQAFMDQKPEGFDTLQEVAEAIANYQPHRPRPRLHLRRISHRLPQASRTGSWDLLMCIFTHSSALLRCPFLQSQGAGTGRFLGWSWHAQVQTALPGADVARLQDTDLGAGRKGASELLGLGRRHPYPLATSLALVTDTVFAATIRIARALTHAGVS